MSYNVKREKDEKEERELEEFVASRKEKTKTIIKNTLIVLVCLILVVAFCLPSLSLLIK